MSDNWIALIPEDPHYVPNSEQQRLAIDRFRQIAQDADEISIKLKDSVQFFDCGVNFEKIICPNCCFEVPMDWWQDRMGEDFKNNGFKLSQYTTPCCSAAHTLQELIYEWPQAFGRFAIEAMNPNIGMLDHEDVLEFERLLGTRLRIVYQHI